MATRSERFRADNEQARSKKNSATRKRTAKKKPAKKDWPREKEHAGKKATYAFEDAPKGKKRTRKSTRKSANRSKADSNFNRMEQVRKGGPEARARRSKAKATRTRGHSNP